MIERILIAAIDADGGIGKDGYMPWHYPEDLKLFMKLTIGSTIVMGRKTFEGMFDRGKAPLKNRQNIIVTSQAADYRLRFAEACASSNDEACAPLGGRYSPSQLTFITDLNCVDLDVDGKVFYCGGAEIYRQLILPRRGSANEFVDVMYLTRFQESYDCDTFFPKSSQSTTTEFIPYIPPHLTLSSTEQILGDKSFTLQTYTRDRLAARKLRR
jgi:dihydrofolate reductase